MTTIVAQLLATESYNKLMPPETGPLKLIEFLRTSITITIDEDGIQNSVSIDLATLVPTAKIAERQIVYTSKEPADKPINEVNDGGGQIIAKGFAEALQECAGDWIVREGVRMIAFDASCACMATHELTIRSGHLYTFLATSLLAIGAELRRVMQCNHEVNQQK